MGYYRIFTPTEEHLKEIRSQYFGGREFIEDNRLRTTLHMLHTCLTTPRNIDYDVFYSQIENLVKVLNSVVRQLTYLNAIERREEDDEKTIYYSGREHSPSNFYDYDSKINLQSLMESLTIAITMEADYFNNEENYYEKINFINDSINSYIESQTMVYRFEIMKLLKDVETGGDNVNSYDIFNFKETTFHPCDIKKDNIIIETSLEEEEVDEEAMTNEDEMVTNEEEETYK